MARSAVRNRVEWAVVCLILGFFRVLPRRLSEAAALAVMNLLRLTVRRYTRVARRNLEIAFPEFSKARKKLCLDGCFRNIARVLVAVAKFPLITKKNVHEWIRYEGFEHFEEALRRGRGVIFATGHLGNWELSAFAHALMAKPMGVVIRPLDNSLLDRMAIRYRTMSGNSVISRRESARPIIQMLRANEAVGILADQNTTEDRGVFVKFFGIPACVDAGIAKLAAHTGASIIPGFAVWSQSERRYILRFYPPIQPTGDQLRDTQAVQAALEAAIRDYPDQWLWIHRRWKTRPSGSPPIYE
ncbi:MAG: lysophospholipid acyltransferase family protein [Bryobacteraceae bacterium]